MVGIDLVAGFALLLVTQAEEAFDCRTAVDAFHPFALSAPDKLAGFGDLLDARAAGVAGAASS
jgi:hypothetical protein